jgi:hypothetical protein
MDFSIPRNVALELAGSKRTAALVGGSSTNAVTKSTNRRLTGWSIPSNLFRVLDSITVERLPHAEVAGSWPDKLSKWRVVGPGAEVKKFATARDARKYKTCRQLAGSEEGAHRIFSGTE